MSFIQSVLYQMFHMTALQIPSKCMQTLAHCTSAAWNLLILRDSSSSNARDAGERCSSRVRKCAMRSYGDIYCRAENKTHFLLDIDSRSVGRSGSERCTRHCRGGVKMGATQWKCGVKWSFSSNAVESWRRSVMERAERVKRLRILYSSRRSLLFYQRPCCPRTCMRARTLWCTCSDVGWHTSDTTTEFFAHAHKVQRCKTKSRIYDGTERR